MRYVEVCCDMFASIFLFPHHVAACAAGSILWILSS